MYIYLLNICASSLSVTNQVIEEELMAPRLSAFCALIRIRLFVKPALVFMLRKYSFVALSICISYNYCS